jgi:hypothetical protein
MPTHIPNRFEKSVLLIIFLGLNIFPVQSQPGNLMPELSLNHGLRNNYVKSVVRDTDGRTWLATESGLKILQPDAQLHHLMMDSMQGKSVLSIGFLKSLALIGTEVSGLRIMNLKSGQFISSPAFDSLQYVRKIRVTGDTAFIAANHAAGYVTIEQSVPVWHPFLWKHLPAGYIMDFYRYQGQVFGFDHNNEIVPYFYEKRSDSLVKTEFPASIPPPKYRIYLTADANEHELKLGGDGFFSSMKSDGIKRFVVIKDSIDDLKMAVWDMANVGTRQFLAMGQPYTMKMGAAYELGVSSRTDIRKDFYCKTLLYDKANDALWMGTANRGLFIWPHISTTHAKPLRLSGKVKVLPFRKGEKLMYNETDVYRIFDAKLPPVLISSSRKGQKFEEIFDVKYWHDSIAVLRASGMSIFDVDGKVLLQKKLTPYSFSHINHLGNDLASFSPYNTGITIFTRNGQLKKQFNGESIEVRSTPYKNGLLYMCEEKGFYFLDSTSHPFSPAINQAQDFLISSDTLWVLNDRKIFRYTIDLKSFKLNSLGEISLEVILPDLQVTWLRKLQNAAILAGDAKGFVMLDRPSAMPQWYRYLGNFSDLENPEVQGDSLLIQQQHWLATVPGSQPYPTGSLKKLQIADPSGTGAEEGKSLEVRFLHPDYFEGAHALKQMDIVFPDGHKESHFTLDSMIRLPQGLPQGSYQVDYFANGQFLESRKWRITIPLLQNPLFYAALCMLIIGLFYFGFMYRSRQKDMERKLLDSRMKLLKKNLDPHFIFNSLNLTYMLLMQGKYEEATASILKFSDLHRYFLEMINKPEVSLAEEFKFLENYLELEQGRLDAETAFQFTIEKSDIDIHGIIIPPMILQPLVENAVKYCGLGNAVVEQRKIMIECYLHNGNAVVSIENTVSSEAVHFSHRLGKGISIVQQMIDIYNRNSGGQITFLPTVECKHFKGGYRCEISMRL